MVKYRCNKCGREFPNKTPHKCLTGFQKRHLTYTRTYEDKPLFEEVDSNILELLKLISKEEQQRVFSWRYSEYCPVPNKGNGFLGFIETYKHLSQIIPKHWTIIDIGAYGNAQSYYFAEHKKKRVLVLFILLTPKSSRKNLSLLKASRTTSLTKSHVGICCLSRNLPAW